LGEIIERQRLVGIHHRQIGVKQADRREVYRPIKHPRSNQLLTGNSVCLGRCVVGVLVDEIHDHTTLAHGPQQHERVNQQPDRQIEARLAPGKPGFEPRNPAIARA
jgi:hypothetical protein